MIRKCRGGFFIDIPYWFPAWEIREPESMDAISYDKIIPTLRICIYLFDSYHTCNSKWNEEPRYRFIFKTRFVKLYKTLEQNILMDSIEKIYGYELRERISKIRTGWRHKSL